MTTEQIHYGARRIGALALAAVLVCGPGSRAAGAEDAEAAVAAGASGALLDSLEAGEGSGGSAAIAAEESPLLDEMKAGLTAALEGTIEADLPREAE